jgi:hypothetical protein
MVQYLKYIPVLALTFGALIQNSLNGYSVSGFYLADSVITDLRDSLRSTEDSLLVIRENLKHGKKLYEKKCQRCHVLHSPKDYKLNKWKENLDEMKDKAELTSTEYKLIFKYLAANCRK